MRSNLLHWPVLTLFSNTEQVLQIKFSHFVQNFQDFCWIKKGIWLKFFTWSDSRFDKELPSRPRIKSKWMFRGSSVNDFFAMEGGKGQGQIGWLTPNVLVCATLLTKRLDGFFVPDQTINNVFLSSCLYLQCCSVPQLPPSLLSAGALRVSFDKKETKKVRPSNKVTKSPV